MRILNSIHDCRNWRVLAGLALPLALSSARAATFTVTNTASAGAGSLSQAIASANSSPGADNITFNIPGAGVQTISGTLPSLTDAVTIDGATQPGYAGLPLINLSTSLTIDRKSTRLNSS